MLKEGISYIFISYCHQEPDHILAHTFANALEKADHRVFIDTDMQWGADWVKEIPKALESCHYFLVLLSPEAAASEMVAEEIKIAKELSHHRDGHPVILPIRVRLPFSDRLPYHIGSIR
ncbi:toll/interleukin-1 receptor domain-containing protein [Candidatus Entotheonella palauensis]|uniref:toll/interleukin-1 receptor domain-containing protein n=1 Tax=Candidatus Entotheonella palauensis TaxID=93172 RepID=UPI000B7FBE44|nr:toll/interleukin-1 receptor domain-containing protein [Candidatus Entotheonella palauensis]